MKTVLHLVRGSEPPAVAERDWLVYFQPLRLAKGSEAPLPIGSIDHEQLVVLIFAADLVITW